MAPTSPSLSSIRPLIWKLKARQSLPSQHKDKYFSLFRVHETFSVSFRIMADDSNKWPNESPSLSPVNPKMRGKVKSLCLGAGLFVCLHTWTGRKGVSARLENEFLGCRQLASGKQASKEQSLAPAGFLHPPLCREHQEREELSSTFPAVFLRAPLFEVLRGFFLVRCSKTSNLQKQ